MIATKIMRRLVAARFMATFNREEFEYLALKYALKGKMINFGPNVDFPEEWQNPYHDGDHKPILINDFRPFSQVWGIQSRYWWRTGIRLAKNSPHVLPITFLLDTASSADVLLSDPAEKALKEHNLLQEGGHSSENYAGTFVADKWNGLHAYKTPSKTGQGKVSIIGGRLIAESGGVKVDSKTKKLIFNLKEFI